LGTADRLGRKVGAMFVRVTWFQGNPERVEERVSDYPQRMSALDGLDGYLGCAAIVDRSTGAGVSVTYWSSTEAMQASEEAGARIRGQAVGEDLTVRDIDHFEMVIQERTAPPRSGTFIRTNDMRGSLAAADAAIAFARDKVLPVLKAQRGFLANLVCVNRETGRILASSIWETAEARAASEGAIQELRHEAGRLAGVDNVAVQLYESAYVKVKVPTPA
jgi:heme-degrading monooxygenase HmoA